MAGQMIMVGFQGTSAGSIQAAINAIANGEAGGVMYLKTNVKSLDAVRAMNRALMAVGGDLPPLIALDQEGGSIERLTQAVGFKEIRSAAKIAASLDPAQAEDVYFNMSRALANLGFNFNFGPVADVNVNTSNPIIARYGRSYGSDARDVTAYAGAFVRAHRRAGVLTSLKHFPGHGSSRGDSHAGFVDISKVWKPFELAPYRGLIDAQLVDVVMAGHLYHSGYADESGTVWPASLSRAWLEGELRQKLGFSGVVITDDMEMGAIRKQYGFEAAIVQAVRAGVDILLFSNTANYRGTLPREVRDILVAEARRDPVFAARIAQSYARIVTLKNSIQ